MRCFVTGKRSGLANFLGEEFSKGADGATDAVTPEISKSITPRVTKSKTLRPDKAVTSAVPVSASSKASKSQTPKLKESTTPRVQESKTSKIIEDLEPELPLYKRLIPKETRFRDDQLEDLARLARRLTRAKSVRGGQRITENTLIRVAVDALLERGDALVGETEEDLLAWVRSN
jgi:hypothetical protein